MRAPAPLRWLTLAVLAVLGACSGGGAGVVGEAKRPPEVRVIASPLSADIDVTVFAMGHSSTNTPFGGKGLLDSHAATGRHAEITFMDVPEGDQYRVDYLGFRSQPTFPARAPARTPWLCAYDRAAVLLRVISGGANEAFLEPDPFTGTCTYLGGDGWVVNPNYQRDSYDPHYGSVDHENFLWLLVYGAPPGPVTFKACDTVDPGCTSPFGLFVPPLPLTPVECHGPPEDTHCVGNPAPWPHHDSSGWARELTVDAPGGEAMVLAVVKPGESPRIWEFEVRYPAGTTPASEVFRVRLSNGNRVDVNAR